VADGGVTLPLLSAPAGAHGRPCIYGIRPEHLTLGGGDPNAEVSVIEPTGSETQVFARLGTQKIVGVFRERISAKPGEMLSIAPNVSAAHLFDSATGVRLQ
jgi:multiple sugar transport system ATP-binding protein